MRPLRVVALLALSSLTACKSAERYAVRDQFFTANRTLMTYTQTVDELVPFVTDELKGRSFEVDEKKPSPDGVTLVSSKRSVRGNAGGTAAIGIDKEDWWEVDIRNVGDQREVVATYKSYGRMAKNTAQRLPTFEFGVLRRVDPARARGLSDAWPAFASQNGIGQSAELVPEVDRARDQLGN